MEEIVITARLAADARVTDVLWSMCQKLVVVEGCPPWDVDQLQVLRDTLRLCVHPLRESRRVFHFFEAKERSGKGINKVHRRQVESDIFGMCSELLAAPRMREFGVCSPDLLAHLTKVRADVWRYCAEVRASDESHRDTALAMYKLALEQCVMLSPDNDVRLATHLNYSVFYREVLKSPDKACEIAKAAVDATLLSLTNVAESKVLLMLRHNLRLWTDQIENPNSEEAARIGQEAV